MATDASRRGESSPGTSLRAAQREFTRQRILNAATEAFQARGYLATTIDDIVGAAGTTRATFYLHYKAKADLAFELLAVAVAGSSVLYPELPEIVADGRRETFRAWLTRAIDYWDEYGAKIAVVHEAAALEPSVRERLYGDRKIAVARIVEGLTAAERFDPALRQLRAFCAWALLERLFEHWLEAGWDFQREDVLDSLADGWYLYLH